MRRADQAVKGEANGADVMKAKLPPLRPDCCYCSEQRTQALIIFAGPGLAAQDVGKAEIWQALSHMLVPFSVGWVIAEDESWGTEFMVRSNLPGRCSVVVLRTVELPKFDHAARRTLPEGIEVFFGGVTVGWVAQRKGADGNVTVIGKGIDHPEWIREEDVIRWVLDHASVRQPPTGPRRFGS